MAPPPPDPAAESSFAELNEAIVEARDALLRYAEAESALGQLVCDESDPDCRYPDVAAVRRDGTVDDLLRLVAGLPESLEEEEERAEDSGLYPTLLELAEAFDIVIDQHSLVFGDAVALAEPLRAAWHAMAGCGDDDPTDAERAEATARLEANADSLPPLIDAASKLSARARTDATSAYEQREGAPWMVEARLLAYHTLGIYLSRGVAQARARALLEAGRPRRAGAGQPARQGGTFERALADMLLGRLVRGVAADPVADALQDPFAGVLPRG